MWAFAPVQDRHAAPAITRALQDLAACPEVEVIVVARGGGSLADLFAFCDETLCRTVAMLRVPVIASVGHHTDRTLIDDVAAVACSTPTHAAEAAVPVDCAAARAALQAGGAAGAPGPRARPRPRAHAGRALARARPHVERHRARLHQQLREMRASSARAVAEGVRAAPSAAPPRSSATATPGRRRARASSTAAASLTLAARHDPQRTLERGYALVEGPGGEPVTSATAAATWPASSTRMRDGSVRVRPDRDVG